MKSSDAIPFCKVCFKETNFDCLSSIYANNNICASCFEAMEPGMRKIRLDRWIGYYLYPYNETLRKMIYDFKGCYDYELRDVFLSRQKEYLKMLFRGYVLVPAPSHESHDEKRGFNHVIEIYKELKLPILPLIKKTKDVKQSDQHFDDRKKIGSALEMKNGESLKGKKVLFVDDILTSGSTARACLSLIEKEKPKRIRFLVLAKTKSKERKDVKSKNNEIICKMRLFLEKIKTKTKKKSS